jgi:hypothetical protein
LSSRSRLRGKINSRCRSRASATMPAKCTEHNGDSPMCQADASCRMRVVAKRRVRRPNEPYILMANRRSRMTRPAQSASSGERPGEQRIRI